MSRNGWRSMSYAAMAGGAMWIALAYAVFKWW